MADDARLPETPPADDRLTDAEFAAMARRGAFQGLGRFELRGGKLHRMSPIYHPHGRTTTRLAFAIQQALDAAGLCMEACVETSIEFGGGFTPTADIAVVEGEFDEFVPGHAARLVVEVAESSLGDDLGAKALAYARMGVPEYLVADVAAKVIHHHWGPKPEGWTNRAVIRFGEPLALRTLPLALDTARLG